MASDKSSSAVKKRPRSEQKSGHDDKQRKRPKKKTNDAKPAAEVHENLPSTWSKSKKKRIRKMKAKQTKTQLTAGQAQPAPTEKQKENETSDVSEQKPVGSKKPSALLNSFKARLTGSRFRTLNEDLYTTTSKESFDRFSKNPELFEQYHEGFRHQVASWPLNPVDVIARQLESTFQNKKSPCVVADFGCGDAQLAKDLTKIKRKSGECPFKIHSFDLVSQNELVTAADMANVPLEDKSVDVCVFCLALMGTNLADFIREAHRVLKDDGRVMIAEVRSRIEYSHSKKGKNDSNSKKINKKGEEHKAGTLDEFKGVLNDLGFKCIRVDKSNKMFLLLELRKTGRKPNQKLEFSAKPCIYKIR